MNFDSLAKKVTAYIKPDEIDAFVELTAMAGAYKIPDYKIELILESACDLDGVRNRFKTTDEVVFNPAVVYSKPCGASEKIFFFHCGRCLASMKPARKSGSPYMLRIRGETPWDTDELAVGTIGSAIAHLRRRFGIPLAAAERSVATEREVVYDFEET